VQTANADKMYDAMDLMQVTVGRGTLVAVAHDDRLPRPAWLARQFTATDLSLRVNGQTMKIFQHRALIDESLTLGVNAENAKLKSCNMYVVFVNGSSGMLVERGEHTLP
jgi:beta-galactosidase